MKFIVIGVICVLIGIMLEYLNNFIGEKKYGNKKEKSCKERK